MSAAGTRANRKQRIPARHTSAVNFVMCVGLGETNQFKAGLIYLGQETIVQIQKF